MECGLKLGPIVGLDLLHLEGKLLEHVVSKLDRGLLIQAVVDLEDPKSGAVVDSRVLVMLLADATDWLDELDVELDRVARLLLLITLPALLVSLVALGSR